MKPICEFRQKAYVINNFNTMVLTKYFQPLLIVFKRRLIFNFLIYVRVNFLDDDFDIVASKWLQVVIQ